MYYYYSTCFLGVVVFAGCLTQTVCFNGFLHSNNQLFNDTAETVGSRGSPIPYDLGVYVSSRGGSYVLDHLSVE